MAQYVNTQEMDLLPAGQSLQPSLEASREA